MLIGGDDISNDVITLDACFHVVFNVCFIRARFRFALIGGNLTPQGTGELEAEFKFQRRSCKLSFLFRPPARAPRRA